MNLQINRCIHALTSFVTTTTLPPTFSRGILLEGFKPPTATESERCFFKSIFDPCLDRFLDLRTEMDFGREKIEHANAPITMMLPKRFIHNYCISSTKGLWCLPAATRTPMSFKHTKGIDRFDLANEPDRPAVINWLWWKGLCCHCELVFSWVTSGLLYWV